MTSPQVETGPIAHFGQSSCSGEFLAFVGVPHVACRLG